MFSILKNPTFKFVSTRCTENLLTVSRVCFGQSFSISNKKDDDFLMNPETFILRKANPTPYSVFVAENIKRVQKDHSDKVRERLSEEYKSLAIGELLKYEEKAEKLKKDQERYRKMVEDLPLEAKDELLLNALEKMEKKIKTKTLKKTNKPSLKRFNVLSLVTLTEEDLQTFSTKEGEHKGLKKIAIRQEKWKTLTEDERDRLSQEANRIREEDKLSYLDELSKWMLSLIENKDFDEIFPILELKEVKMVLDHLAGIKPTKARSARNLFLSSDLGKELGVTVKNQSELYNKLSREQKGTFEEMAKKEKERAEKERLQWQNMLEQKGYTRLIQVWKELCVMHGKKSNVHS
ncbi:nucleolar transcription factor 1-A-like [Saccostrea cucullata]|uniref:nucleolar transcription factor 1-A-like n=1 Tax=Saccostrea cuccullata TaxID=36930 RepID=UPI002ED41BCB